MDVEFVKYRYENKYDEEIPDNKFKIGVRHLQILYMFLTSVTMGVVRGCMGVAWMAVTDKTRINDTYIQIHTWDNTIQGTFLFAFFFGYAVMFIPAEMWLKRIGGKYVHVSILLINGALCSAMPTIINKGSVFAVFSAMLLMGMTQTAISPANQALLDNWLPGDERRKFSWAIYGGVLLGIIIGPPVAGVLSEAALGWELIYYSLSMITFSMAVICLALTSNSPEQHQAVGDTEKEYIHSLIAVRQRLDSSVPWRDIFKSTSFWGIACAHAFSNSLFVFYLTGVPVYLTNFNLSLKDSAAWMILPFFALWITYATMKPVLRMIMILCDLNSYSNIMNVPHQRINVRKVINVFCAVGSLIILFILPLLISNACATILLLVALAGLLGLQFHGFLENIADVTVNYTEDVLMLSSGLANVVGSLIPLVTGLILRDDETNLYRWRNVLLFLATLCVVCNALYITFARNYRMQFDMKPDRFVRKVPNNSVYSPIEMQLVPEM